MKHARLHATRPTIHRVVSENGSVNCVAANLTLHTPDMAAQQPADGVDTSVHVDQSPSKEPSLTETQEDEEEMIAKFEAVEDANPGSYRLRQNLINFAYEEYALRLRSGSAHGAGMSFDRASIRKRIGGIGDDIKFSRKVQDMVNRMLSTKHHPFVLDLNTLLTSLAAEAMHPSTVSDAEDAKM